MKILIVGYACDPYRGSEPGVGWTAVCRIARKHEVFVLTDDHNRRGWERGRTEGIIPPNVHVRFLRKERSFLENRFLAHIQSWMFYSSFNRQVLAAAETWHREENFDLCHQVTIAAWRMPSPLWQLPVPFVWGPIGGAGYIPPEFRSMLSSSSRLFEKARDINTALSSHSPAFRKCIRNTAVVFVANEETETFLKPFRGERPLIRLPIASIPEEKALQFRRPSESWLEAPRSSPSPEHLAPALTSSEHSHDKRVPKGPLRLFAGGNMEGRKGVSLALHALAIVADKGIDFHYIVAGGGPEIPALRSLTEKLHLAEKVEFHPGFQGDDYVRELQKTDVYFLPSFRESTPVTLLESYLAGCYPVVADTSAQGEIVRMAGGKAVPVESMASLVQGLADAVIWCAEHRDELPALATQAAELVADYFSSKRYDETIREAYELAVKQKPKS